MFLNLSTLFLTIISFYVSTLLLSLSFLLLFSLCQMYLVTNLYFITKQTTFSTILNLYLPKSCVRNTQTSILSLLSAQREKMEPHKRDPITRTPTKSNPNGKEGRYSASLYSKIRLFRKKTSHEFPPLYFHSTHPRRSISHTTLTIV